MFTIVLSLYGLLYSNLALLEAPHYHCILKTGTLRHSTGKHSLPTWKPAQMRV